MRKIKALIDRTTGQTSIVDSETGDTIEHAEFALNITRPYDYRPVLHLTVINPEIEFIDAEQQGKASPFIGGDK